MIIYNNNIIMEYQKTICFLDNTPNQPSKIRTKNCFEINEDSLKIYNTNSRIKFKAAMLKSNLCDCNDAYILVKGTIALIGKGANAEPIRTDKNNKRVIFKHYTLFTDCITEINNTQLHNAKDLDVVMSMYNRIEYSDNYSGTTGSLW